MTKRRTTIYTGGYKTPGVLFQGETIHCVMCGKEKKSDPKVESQWTAVEVDKKPYYVCPDHIPVNGTEADYKAAYDVIFSKVLELHGRKR